MGKRKQRTFAEEVQRQLNLPMKDANGNQVVMNGRNASTMEVLAQTLVHRAFKDPRIAISLIKEFGKTPVAENMPSAFDQMMSALAEK